MSATRRGPAVAPPSTIEDITPGEWSPSGEATAQAPDGREVRLFGGIPHERAAVRIVAAGQHRIVAVWESSPDPSPDRATGETCRVWQACRGCDWIHLTPPARAREKRATVERALAGVGLGEVLVSPICCGSRDVGYRARAIYSFDRETGLLGAFARGTHQVVDTRRCPIHHADQNRVAEIVAERARHTELRAALRHLAVRRSRAGSLQITLALRPGSEGVIEVLADRLSEALFEVSFGLFTCEVPDTSNRVLVPPFRLVLGEAELEERFGESVFGLGPGDFFQANLELAEALAAHLLEVLRPKPGDRALDLYCGVGPHALGLARRGARVLGVERSEAAVDAARRNAARNGLDDVEFLAEAVGEGALEEWLTALGGTPRIAVVNPPRKGLEPGVAERLAELCPERLAYVSCSPEALARDLIALRERGFRIEAAWPYDLLPQTRHVETLVLLT